MPETRRALEERPRTVGPVQARRVAEWRILKRFAAADEAAPREVATRCWPSAAHEVRRQAAALILGVSNSLVLSTRILLIWCDTNFLAAHRYRYMQIEFPSRTPQEGKRLTLF